MGLVKTLGAGIAATWLVVSCVGAAKDTALGDKKSPEGSASFSQNFGKNLVETGTNAIKGGARAVEGVVEGVRGNDNVPSDSGECTPEKVRKDPYHPDCAMR